MPSVGRSVALQIDWYTRVSIYFYIVTFIYFKTRPKSKDSNVMFFISGYLSYHILLMYIVTLSGVWWW